MLSEDYIIPDHITPTGRRNLIYTRQMRVLSGPSGILKIRYTFSIALVVDYSVTVTFTRW